MNKNIKKTKTYSDSNQNSKPGAVGVYKSGFTLIELIVVMAIIAILVLLAMPRFSDKLTEAKTTQIKSDIKTVEHSIDEYLLIHDTLPSEWADKIFPPIGTLYDLKGEINPDTVEAGPYKVIDGTLIAQSKTNLDGTFISNNQGTVYYESDKSIEGGSDDTPDIKDFVVDYEVNAMIAGYLFEDLNLKWVATENEVAEADETDEWYFYDKVKGTWPWPPSKDTVRVYKFYIDSVNYYFARITLLNKESRYEDGDYLEVHLNTAQCEILNRDGTAIHTMDMYTSTQEMYVVKNESGYSAKYYYEDVTGIDVNNTLPAFGYSPVPVIENSVIAANRNQWVGFNRTDWDEVTAIGTTGDGNEYFWEMYSIDYTTFSFIDDAVATEQVYRYFVDENNYFYIKIILDKVNTTVSYSILDESGAQVVTTPAISKYSGYLKLDPISVKILNNGEYRILMLNRVSSKVSIAAAANFTLK